MDSYNSSQFNETKNFKHDTQQKFDASFQMASTIQSGSALKKNDSKQQVKHLSVGFGDKLSPREISINNSSVALAPTTDVEIQEPFSPTKLTAIKGSTLFDNLKSGTFESYIDTPHGVDELNRTIDSQFNSTLSARLITALHKHVRTQSHWIKTIQAVKKEREKINVSMTRSKKNYARQVNNSLGSLIERQCTFKYDDDGVK